MNLNQVKWAKSHDWYVCSDASDKEFGKTDFSVVVKEIISSNEFGLVTETKTFKSFQELKDWAGY